jgi:hypothetical protein
VDIQRYRRSGRLIHTRRVVVASRPLHISMRVRNDAPRLRRQEVLDRFRELRVEAGRRGVRTVAAVLMGSHLHWLVVADSPAALWDATRFVFGQLARFLNLRAGRRGKVFEDRYASRCCRSVKDAYAAIGYVLRNPSAAGCRVPARGLDRFTDLGENVLAGDPFLRSVVGPTPGLRRSLLLRMAREAVPFVPLAERRQPRLPGL